MKQKTLNPIDLCAHLLDLCNRINRAERALEKTHDTIHSVIDQENSKSMALVLKIGELEKRIEELEKCIGDKSRRTESTVN